MTLTDQPDTDALPPERLPPIPTPAEQTASLRRRTYRAVLELSARHPLLDSRDIALMLGISEAWVRRLTRSDAFIAQRAELIEQLHGPRLAEIRTKMEDTLGHLVTSIAKRIADPDAVVSEDTLLQAFKLLADRVFPQTKGTPPPPDPRAASPVTQIVFNGIGLEDIERAKQMAIERGRVLELEPQNHKEVIDVDEDGLRQVARVRSNEGID